MDRRAFIIGGVAALAAPVAADAQATGKIYRIGYLAVSATSSERPLGAFREGLRELGWVEGQNIVIEYRFAQDRFDRLRDLAAELVRRNVEVIVAAPRPPVVAAKNAAGTIPIVMGCSGKPFPRSDVWRSSRTRTIRAPRSR